MKPYDIVGIIILSIFYFLQGLSIGLPMGSLPIILVEKGASYTDISAITFSGLPFSCKILWASFLDKYFIKSFGKRKTYIIPGKYLVGIIFVVYSFYLDQHIQTLNIMPIAVIMFLLLFLEATTDIAIDGWVLTILSEENVALGPTCQSVGQNLGWFLSQFIFVQLTSVKFANDYVYSEPSTEPLISYGGYMRFWGIFTLIFVFIVHFFKKEINPQTREFSSVWEVFKTLKGFYLNKNLRFLCFVYLTYKIGFIFMEGAGFLELVRRGLPKETLTTISICAYPIQFIGPIWIAKYTLQKLEFTISFRGVFISILFVIGMMFTINVYSHSEGTSLIALVAVMLMIGVVGRMMMEVPCAAFNTRICDEKYGGTFITALASVLNVNRAFLVPLGLTILDYMNFYVANVIGIVYSIAFIYQFHSRCIEMQSLPKQTWSLEHNSELDGYVEMKDPKKSIEY